MQDSVEKEWLCLYIMAALGFDVPQEDFCQAGGMSSAMMTGFPCNTARAELFPSAKILWAKNDQFIGISQYDLAFPSFRI